jgi:Uma2 family endonuclease
MAAAKTLLTAEQFDNYPFEEDKRYELDEGELIVTDRPAYNHNRIVGRLTYYLCMYFRDNPTIGEALISENVYAIGPRTRRSPDVAVILGDRYEELKDATVIPIIPEIAAEALSPDENTRTLFHKLRQYFDAGVREGWIINPSDRTVEIWTSLNPPDRDLSVGDILTSPLLPGFTLTLEDLFA